jgi:hypothetical protein
LQRAGCSWYPLDINIYSLSKKSKSYLTFVNLIVRLYKKKVGGYTRSLFSASWVLGACPNALLVNSLGQGNEIHDGFPILLLEGFYLNWTYEKINPYIFSSL